MYNSEMKGCRKALQSVIYYSLVRKVNMTGLLDCKMATSGCMMDLSVSKDSLENMMPNKLGL